MVEIVLALIGAVGTVLTAYVVNVLPKLRRAVNGQLDELRARVTLLEEVLSWPKPQRQGESASTFPGDEHTFESSDS